MSTPRSLPIFAYLSPWVGAAVGYGASQLEARFAPVGLFPVLVGLATGLGVIACMRLAACGCRRGCTVAGAVAALIAVGTMHYSSYRTASVAAEAAWQKYQDGMRAAPNVAFQDVPTPIADFGDFWRRAVERGRPWGERNVVGAGLVAWWAIDAALCIAAAAATAYFLSPPPEPPLVQLEQGSTR